MIDLDIISWRIYSLGEGRSSTCHGKCTSIEKGRDREHAMVMSMVSGTQQMWFKTQFYHIIALKP